ncbi:hypothetical protein Tco_0992766 [Tanacetum coccineum]|uniref:Uncharacterized protein n=1 Tax=Tanacetum coccineum TaxID=301880 RepID=A0ABQ5F4H8_9ASTR
MFRLALPFNREVVSLLSENRLRERTGTPNVVVLSMDAVVDLCVDYLLYRLPEIYLYIDADVEVTLVDETQERQDDELMFDTGVLDADEMPVEAKVDEKDEQSTKLDDSTAGEAVTTASVEDSVAPTTIEEITLAQTLIQIKAAKPKVVTTAATTTTTTRPKAKGVVVQEPSEFRVPQEAQPSISKDKGKCIMVEPEVPLKRKDQIALDEQIARDIQAKLDAELIEEQKLARKQEEEANIALIESWENTQAMMEADRLLAERLQSKEREELTDEEKGKLFMELMEKRRKHFAALRAQEKRNIPPTKAQKRTQMSTYLKHMGGYTYKQLKGKSFDEIQKLFDKEMKRVNTFVAMGSEVQESKEKKVEGSEETAKGSRKKMLGRKRAGKEQQQESSKKQRMEEDKESDEVDEASEDDEGELMKHLVIKKDDDIAIDAIPLATKLPVIIDYKLHKEGMLVHYQLIRADGSSKRYSSMIRMLQDIDREDLETLWKLVKTKHGDTRPEDEHERVLLGDLKVMFEPDIRSEVWRNLQGYTVNVWKLYDSCGVHFVRFGNVHIFMLVEKRYPLTPITITNMLNKKLQTDHFNEMCYQLLKLMIQKMNIKFRGGLLGLKRLQGFLELLLLRSIAIAITPVLPTKELDNSLSMGNEHLSTIPETESDELIKSSVKNPVPIPSESEDFFDIESKGDVPICDNFTTFSNPLFDADDDTLIVSSPKFDSLLEEFSGKLAHIDLISPEIDEADFDSEEEIRLVEKLLYDNSSPQPPKEFNSENSDVVIESFSVARPSLLRVSFHFDRYYVPSSPRPSEKPLDDDDVYFDIQPDAGVFTKVVDDISDKMTEKNFKCT